MQDLEYPYITLCLNRNNTFLKAASHFTHDLILHYKHDLIAPCFTQEHCPSPLLWSRHPDFMPLKGGRCLATPPLEPPGLMTPSAGGALDVEDMIQRSQTLRREPGFLPKTQTVLILFKENSEDKVLLCILYPALLCQGSVVKAHVSHWRCRLNSLFHPCSPKKCLFRFLAGWGPQWLTYSSFTGHTTSKSIGCGRKHGLKPNMITPVGREDLSSTHLCIETLPVLFKHL